MEENRAIGLVLYIVFANDELEVFMSAIRILSAGCLAIVLLLAAGCGDDESVVTPPGNKPKLTQVTNDPGQELLPRFTPGGEQIVYEAWRFPEGDRRVLITSESLP